MPETVWDFQSTLETAWDLQGTLETVWDFQSTLETAWDFQGTLETAWDLQLTLETAWDFQGTLERTHALGLATFFNVWVSEDDKQPTHNILQVIAVIKPVRIEACSTTGTKLNSSRQTPVGTAALQYMYMCRTLTKH